jgi:hypothetical protein
MFKKALFIIALLVCGGCMTRNDYQPEKIGFTNNYLPQISSQAISCEVIDDITLTVYEHIQPYHHRYGAYVTIEDIDYYLGDSASMDFNLARSPYFVYDSHPIYCWFEDYRAAATGGTTHFLGFWDGMPVELFNTGGYIEYYDLDENGTPELVVSYSSQYPAEVEIYFWMKDADLQLTKIDVNRALDAYSVYFKDGVVIMYKSENATPTDYVYSDGLFGCFHQAQSLINAASA